MTRSLTAACAVALVCLLAVPRSARCDDGPLEIASYTWLELLDRDRFDDAWREASPILQEGTTQAQWVDATRKVRAQFGPVTSRSVLSKDYHRQLEGGPDGNYFTLRIRTGFANGGQLVEVVTVTASSADPQYRVAAYGIKR